MNDTLVDHETIKITLYDKNAHIIFSKCGVRKLHVCINHVYEDGDYIAVCVPEKQFINIKLDESVGTATIYAKNDCSVFRIPSGDERLAYPVGAFAGEYHIYDISIMVPEKEERDISTNPLDIRGETGFFPHCVANVETRDEAVFAARNTIDGYCETECHGIWPFTSWGDNEDPNAEITVHFGRSIIASKVVINLRSDFPHDNFWKHAQIVCSDGTAFDISMQKTGEDQVFYLNDILTDSITMKKLEKDNSLISCFPALTQWRIYGKEQNYE